MKKEITMSVKQFMDMERNETTINQIIKENNLESLSHEMIGNKDLKRIFIIICIGCTILIIPTLTYDLPEKLQSIHKVVKNMTYVSIGFGTIHEIRKLISGRKWKEISFETFKYGLAFCCVYFAEDFFKFLLGNILEINALLVTDIVAYSYKTILS